MSDDILIEFYDPLIEDEIFKTIIHLISEQRIEKDKDMEKILEICLNSIEKVD
jgi:hypothetical protein